MNKSILKGIVIYSLVIFFMMSVLVADITIIPMIITLILIGLSFNTISNMSSEEVYKATGITFLQNKFKNNALIQSLTEE